MYIVAEKLAENPYIAPPDLTTENCSLYFDEDTVGKLVAASRSGNIIR